MTKAPHDSYSTRSTLTHQGKTYAYSSLAKLPAEAQAKVKKLPYSLKILLENLLRREDGVVVKKADIDAVLNWSPRATPDYEIQFMPARVVLQDFTGVPCIADLAAMRGAVKDLGLNPDIINPLQPVDLVIDHSVQVDQYGSSLALAENGRLDFERNLERYEFLKWGQGAFKNFRVVPPSTGIVHQVNLEYLSPLTMKGRVSGKEEWLYPDTVVGTDSHTPMINALGVVGWGVGGIEAEAAMLGQPCSMLIPEVIGVRFVGKLNAGVTATDLVLTVTQILRRKGVVGKFVEYFGPGVNSLSIATRATLANMSPEYGATIGIFAVTQSTIDYLKLTGRDEQAELSELYFKAQGLWADASSPVADYTDVVELDLSTVEPCLAGPARPQDRVTLGSVRKSFRSFLVSQLKPGEAPAPESDLKGWVEEKIEPLRLAPELLPSHPDSKFGIFGKQVSVRQPDGTNYQLTQGSVVIAAITSCTNTSNPWVLVGAGLLARNAVHRGLQVKPWVKTSFAPGSKAVTEYMVDSGLMDFMEGLRFHLVGYGCTTCIGNSGPLPEHIHKAIVEGNLSTASVLSGNRNFEARVNPIVRANYLASPPLVVAYALAGNVNLDLTTQALGRDPNGLPVYLKDIWPSDQEVEEFVAKYVTGASFRKVYSDVFAGDDDWKKVKAPTGQIYQWNDSSTYIKEPPFVKGVGREVSPLKDISKARVLALLGDSVTTDHISPAGSIGKSSPAGSYLTGLGVKSNDFNSYGARRGNHEVMVRGTFANVRIKNLLVPGVEGGVTHFFPENKQISIYDAAMGYEKLGIPTVILAGKEYGSGSSRDWAAKGPRLQGIRAVIAESYERIHRSNLIGMGILPLQFLEGATVKSLGLTGKESFDIVGLNTLKTGESLQVRYQTEDGRSGEFSALVRIDTANELEYFRNGGILPYVLRQIVAQNS